jgi:hypothetical protein
MATPEQLSHLSLARPDFETEQDDLTCFVSGDWVDLLKMGLNEIVSIVQNVLTRAKYELVS